LGCLKIPQDGNVLAGVRDDAGVYKLRDDLAIVETVDMIAAIVDEPYSFGMIAAANGISDIYAMGGKPITAMNIVGFPSESMDISVLSRILQGALAKLNEAGVILIGGHSVRNDEVKFGLSVTGTIHPDHIITKGGAEVGDKLIITKPIGTGILTTALKAEMLPASVTEKLVVQMSQLNDKACQAMLEVGVHACTDVTGFALLGHAGEIAENSGTSLEIDSQKVPIIPESMQFAHMGLIPEGMYANWEYRNSTVQATDIDEDTMSVLYDPQTSGGLLMCVAPEKCFTLLERLHELGVSEAAEIGRVVEAAPYSQIIVL
jgi:selenide,water dikinase